MCGDLEAPAPWTAEGKDISRVSRRIVPVAEVWRAQAYFVDEGRLRVSSTARRDACPVSTTNTAGLRRWHPFRRTSTSVVDDDATNAEQARRAPAQSELIRQLGDHVDTIAHELAELLGAPSALAEPDAAAPDDREARGGAPRLTSIAGGAP